ncbi:MAG: cobalt/nickel transport system permease protein [Clostridiales bacterium]|jgi:cobalt/nickel transport system permease protein|nr:cobalt/nickel transport system permease protein [Clostridiales bacterium]
MHISDALISPAVGAAFWGISLATAAYAVKKVDLQTNSEKLPLAGVMGAFTFAAQMINFTIPGTGASGHLGGGLLLAILLGPHLGFLTMMSLLLIQALFFGDGGLIAYGANVFNMGILTCYMIYPLVYKVLKNRMGKLAIVFSAVVGLGIGAFAVAVETSLSGVIALPFTLFAGVMVPIHLVIGLVEGGITLAVVNYLRRFIPEKLAQMETDAETAFSPRKAMVSIGGLAAAIAGLLAYYASANPDGLEWSVLKVAKTIPEKAIHPAGEAIQNVMSIFSDYQIAGMENARISVGLAGLIGSVLTLLLVMLVVKSAERLKQR